MDVFYLLKTSGSFSEPNINNGPQPFTRWDRWLEEYVQTHEAEINYVIIMGLLNFN